MIDLAADSAVFVGDFGESVKVEVSGGAPRVVTAVVNRTPFEDTPDAPYAGHRRQPLHLLFRNSQTYGLTPAEAKLESTKVRVAAVLGDKASVRLRPITRLIRHNAGTVLVEVNL